mgnify:CR=1 FL=1
MLVQTYMGGGGQGPFWKMSKSKQLFSRDGFPKTWKYFKNIGGRAPVVKLMVDKDVAISNLAKAQLLFLLLRKLFLSNCPTVKLSWILAYYSRDYDDRTECGATHARMLSPTNKNCRFPLQELFRGATVHQ